ncbi:MAG: hypothetical protein IPN95_31160 [Bacteroidetes bacterium]|nr:hypothetical protein [Bacteroidota bacterium]
MRKLPVLFLLLFLFAQAQTQNVGIGQATPVSKLDINGGLAVGSAYSGVSAAPANGAIVQGNVGIGTATPGYRLHVVGDVRFEGDFINQEVAGVHANAVQNVPFTNGVFNPINGSVVSITIPDGNGVNNSGLLVTGFARIFGGALNGGSSSMGGYFVILQRDVSPAFAAPTNLTLHIRQLLSQDPQWIVHCSNRFWRRRSSEFCRQRLDRGHHILLPIGPLSQRRGHHEWYV